MHGLPLNRIGCVCVDSGVCSSNHGYSFAKPVDHNRCMLLSENQRWPEPNCASAAYTKQDALRAHLGHNRGPYFDGCAVDCAQCTDTAGAAKHLRVLSLLNRITSRSISNTHWSINIEFAAVREKYRCQQIATSRENIKNMMRHMMSTQWCTKPEPCPR